MSSNTRIGDSETEKGRVADGNRLLQMGCHSGEASSKIEV